MQVKLLHAVTQGGMKTKRLHRWWHTARHLQIGMRNGEPHALWSILYAICVPAGITITDRQRKGGITAMMKAHANQFWLVTHNPTHSGRDTNNSGGIPEAA